MPFQHFLDNVKGGNRKKVLHRKGQPSPLAMAGALQHFVRAQYACEKFVGGYQVASNSPSLQGMQTKLLQSLFLGKVTKADNQSCKLPFN